MLSLKGDKMSYSSSFMCVYYYLAEECSLMQHRSSEASDLEMALFVENLVYLSLNCTLLNCLFRLLTLPSGQCDHLDPAKIWAGSYARRQRIGTLIIDTYPHMQLADSLTLFSFPKIFFCFSQCCKNSNISDKKRRSKTHFMLSFWGHVLWD